MDALPADAYAAALTSLPAMGPRRLRALLGRWSPPDAWQRVLAGRAASDPQVAAVLGRARSVGDRWRAAAVGTDPGALWAAHERAGVGVVRLGSPRLPDALASDPDPPELLFTTGDLGVLEGPRVAIVGTRRCTRYGRDVARELGRDLAAAGVRVVSGLALGIDGAAHLGALDASAAPPVAVVATGLDVVYPRRHEKLWRRVEAAGLVLSEAPLGTAPERWRFPARNRLIAALADVVVIVESHARGGSLITAREAVDRDRPVMAVPGPVRSRASDGANALLHDGAAPVRDAGDVLVLLGLDAAAVSRGAAVAPDDPAAQRVLDAVGWQPATLEQIVVRSGLPVAAVAGVLASLEADGWLARQGAWFERASGR